MITLVQLKEFLLQYGITAPDFILTAIIATVNVIEPCLDGGGKTDSEKLLISAYACTLLILKQGYKSTKSEKLPSGASRTYTDAVDDQFEDLHNNLLTLDTDNCTATILPPSLTVASDSIGFFAVVKPSC